MVTSIEIPNWRTRSFTKLRLQMLSQLAAGKHTARQCSRIMGLSLHDVYRIAKRSKIVFSSIRSVSAEDRLRIMMRCHAEGKSRTETADLMRVKPPYVSTLFRRTTGRKWSDQHPEGGTHERAKQTAAIPGPGAEAPSQ